MSRLSELKLNYHISLRNIRGEKDDETSGCYGRECKNIKDAQYRHICKEKCQQRSLDNALSKLSGLIGKCQYSDHPSVCRRKIRSLMNTYRDRLETSRGREKDARAEIIASKAIKRRAD
jgi:hypothetical protein